MAEYEELRTALRWLILSQLAPMPRYMRGRLGNGQGKVKVPGRHDDYSYVRPSRSTDDVIEVFNKEVSGGDGTPVLVGELPWQPGLTQIVSVDWETYIQVGWGDGYAGIALHGPTHVWRDGFVGTDAFNIFRRQIAPMRTYPLGSGSSSIYVSPYDYLWNGQPVSWCGLPGLDLSAATPATGQARLMLTYLDMENNVIGVVTGSIDVYSDAIELARPALPTGTWAPSAYVRLFGGQSGISEAKDIRDARQLWNSASAVPSGPAGGDLTGTYPDPTVRAIQGFPVSSATPNEGDLLVFTGTSWAPQESPWMRALSGAAYRTLFDQSDTLQSAAIISGGAITDNGDGTVAVAAGEGLVKSANSAVGENYFMEWAADPSVTMVTGTINWLYIDYNAGSPQVAVESASIYNLDLRTEVVLGRVWREGTTSHCLNAGQQFANYMTVACFKDFEVWGFQRASGMITTEIGTRSIDVTAGVMYCAHSRITTSHSTGTFSSWYRDGGGGWTEVANQMQIDNSNWDDGTGVLNGLTPNRYAVHWLYIDHDGTHLHVQYGQGDYTKAGAEDAVVPTTLPFLQSFGLLIAKITVQDASATFESVQLPWDVQFTGASPVDHGDLAGLGDNDHPQYLLVGAEACGDLTGTYPCPEVSGLHGYDLLSTVPQTGYGLMFTGSAWRPIPWPGATPSGAAGGDLTGSYPNPLVVGINGDPIDTGVAPAEGDALIHSASGTNYWRPADHGYLGGLADDDHIQYLLINGTRPMTGELEADLGISIPTGQELKIDTDEDTSIRCPSPYDDRFRFKIGNVDIFDIWVTGTHYWFHGLQDGYTFGLWGYDAGHNRKAMILADPDDTVQLHFAGATRFNTSTDGILLPATLRLDFNNNDDSIRASAAGQLDFEIAGTDLYEMDGEGIKALTRVMDAIWFHHPLTSGLVAGQQFRDNDASYPAGWDEDDAALETNTNQIYGLWYLRSNSVTTTWQYSKATGWDLEADAAVNQFCSFMYGPIFWRDGQYTADLDYTFGIYGSTGGVMDVNTYNRVRLHWDQGTTTWQIRGETRAGATDTQTATAYNDFGFPLHQPIWVRLVIRNTSKVARNYIGTAYFPRTHTIMSNIAEVTTWGALHYMIELDRAGGVEDYLYIGNVDTATEA